jgi:hypothetical protein
MLTAYGSQPTRPPSRLAYATFDLDHAILQYVSIAQVRIELEGRLDY